MVSFGNGTVSKIIRFGISRKIFKKFTIIQSTGLFFKTFMVLFGKVTNGSIFSGKVCDYFS